MVLCAGAAVAPAAASAAAADGGPAVAGPHACDSTFALRAVDAPLPEFKVPEREVIPVHVADDVYGTEDTRWQAAASKAFDEAGEAGIAGLTSPTAEGSVKIIATLAIIQAAVAANERTIVFSRRLATLRLLEVHLLLVLPAAMNAV